MQIPLPEWRLISGLKGMQTAQCLLLAQGDWAKSEMAQRFAVVLQRLSGEDCGICLQFAPHHHLSLRARLQN